MPSPILAMAASAVKGKTAGVRRGRTTFIALIYKKLHAPEPLI
jgi:hypothetical protein